MRVIVLKAQCVTGISIGLWMGPLTSFRKRYSGKAQLVCFDCPDRGVLKPNLMNFE